MPTLDFWDYVTFASLFIIGFAGILLAIFILGLPGKIAIARKHPEAEAVNLMGWLGFVAVVPWVQALVWALKPTNVVDVRRWPKEEREATEEDIMKLTGKAMPDVSTETKGGKPGSDPLGGMEKNCHGSRPALYLHRDAAPVSGLVESNNPSVTENE